MRVRRLYNMCAVAFKAIPPALPVPFLHRAEQLTQYPSLSEMHACVAVSHQCLSSVALQGDMLEGEGVGGEN